MNWLYLAGSLAGIALIVGLNVMLFGATGVKIASAADVIRRLKDEIAGFRAGDVALDAGQRAALVENARDGVLHLVVARGDGLVTRSLKKGALKKLTRDGATLSLRLADFTLPRATLTLPDEALAADWETRVARLAA
jgi:hypothetical protein